MLQATELLVDSRTFRFACNFARQASSGVRTPRDNGIVAKLTSAFAVWLAATSQSPHRPSCRRFEWPVGRPLGGRF